MMEEYIIYTYTKSYIFINILGKKLNNSHKLHIYDEKKTYKMRYRAQVEYIFRLKTTKK